MGRFLNTVPKYKRKYLALMCEKRINISMYQLSEQIMLSDAEASVTIIKSVF
jgi:hypothetical protein